MVRMIAEYSEFQVQRVFSPLRPYLAKIGRFLLVSTFLEDSVRIVVQWDEQLDHLHYYRQFGWSLAAGLLSLIVALMLMSSLMVLFSTKRFVNAASYTLMAVIVLQAFVYGLYTDPSYILRGLALAGSLILLMAQGEQVRLNQDKRIYAGGLPSVHASKILLYYPLCGRILLIMLFLAIIFAGELSSLRLTIGVFGLLCCTMVVLGFKAKTTSALLIALLSVSNVLLNNWWSLHETHPSRDFVKYDFFQTLSIIGGYLLLVEQGPGAISVDGNKRLF